VPRHLRQALPLHLRETVIKRHGSAVLDVIADSACPSVPSRGPSRPSIRDAKSPQRLASTVVKEPPPPPPPPPQIPVHVQQGFLLSQCCSVVAWSLLAVALLTIYATRFFSPLRDDMHRFVGDAALLKLEAQTMAALAPALAIVRSAGLSAWAGLFNTSDPVASIALAVIPDMALAPAVRHVQIAGAPGNLALLRPGTLHDPNLLPEARRALVYSSSAAACEGMNPLACFGLNVSGLRLRTAPSDVVGVGWLGPEFLQVGPQGEPLGADQWVLAVHLMALVQLDAAANRSVAIDVAVDLSGVAEAARQTSPVSGAAYVCTESGHLLGGSDWQPAPAADPRTGEVVYPRVWDLPVDSLLGLSPAAVAAGGRSERWHGRGPDLVIAQPLLTGSSVGTGAGNSAGSLRAVVLLPRSAAVRPLLGHLALAAIGVIAAPAVACLFAVLTCSISRLVACACRSDDLDDDDPAFQRPGPVLD